MPGSKLHQKAKKKLSDGLTSWRKKRKNRTPLPEVVDDDITLPETAEGAAFDPTPPLLRELACHRQYGPEEFLEHASCSRDGEKSDSTTSPSSPPPCLSPGDGSGVEDSDHFINNLFNDIIDNSGDSSGVETDGDGTLVGLGEELDTPPSPASLSWAEEEDDVFWPRPKQNDGQEVEEEVVGAQGGFRHYCGSVGSVLGRTSNLLLEDDLSDDDSNSASTLLNFTLSTDEDEEVEDEVEDEEEAEEDTVGAKKKKEEEEEAMDKVEDMPRSILQICFIGKSEKGTFVCQPPSLSPHSANTPDDNHSQASSTTVISSSVTVPESEIAVGDLSQNGANWEASEKSEDGENESQISVSGKVSKKTADTDMSPQSVDVELPEDRAVRSPLVPFPQMRALRSSAAKNDTLNEIHSMLDLTQVEEPVPSFKAPSFSFSLPDLVFKTDTQKMSESFHQNISSAVSPSPAAGLRSKPTQTFVSANARSSSNCSSLKDILKISKAAKTASSSPKNGVTFSLPEDTVGPLRPKRPVHLALPSSPKLPSIQENCLKGVKRRCLSRSSDLSPDLHISNIPEDLCVCHCDVVCQSDVEVKHVHISPHDRLSPDQVSQPIKVIAAYKVKVCHHPQCTEDNNSLPLLLCRQCDLDIHRLPEFTGHLVLDVSSKRSSGSYSRQCKSPADSESEEERQTVLPDDEFADGRQLFVKKPSKEFKRHRSPSEVERKLKRKKAVKKRSFSKNDSNSGNNINNQQQRTLEAALEQIAHPEGPDLMANLSLEGEADGEASGDGPRPSRKDSAVSGDPTSPERRESVESSGDPGLPPLAPRVPVRRQSRNALQDNFFTIKVCINDPAAGDRDELEVVAAVSNTTLRDALEPILDRRGIDINGVNAFIEKSNTPLPLSSNTSFLAGNTLVIKEKDDQGLDMVSQGAGAKQRPSSASKAPSTSGKGSKSAGRNSRRDSVGVPSLLEPPPSKQRRGSLQLPFREHFFASSHSKLNDLKTADDPLGSLRTRRGQNLSIDDTHTVPSTSPQGTLTLSEGKKNRSQKLSVVSLFANTSAKDREKHEQMQELLAGYSSHGLPSLPELVNIGRPVFSDTAFQLESHWSCLIDNASALTKRQHDQQEAVWELLNTELSYISQIRVIIDVFKSCLLNVQQESLLNEIDVGRLFSNIDQILDSNCQLWQDSLTQVLEDARATRRLFNPSLLKEAFTREFEKLIPPYARYCMEQKQCVEYMKARHSDNDLFKIFVMWAEAQKQCNRLKLTDLLVKPMQRLTKYSLLLQAILRKTDDDRQRRDLLEMIASVDRYVSSINSQMQQQHEQERVEAIMTKIESYDAVEAPNDECVKILQEYNNNFNLLAPLAGFQATRSRSLLMHSSLRLKEAQTRAMDVDCFLFSDLILVCKASKRMDKFKIIKPPMRLDQLVVSDLKDKGSFLLIYINEYHIPIAAYTFHGDAAAVRVWLEKIREAQKEYRHQKLEEDQRIRRVPVMETVEYSPLSADRPLTMSPGIPRSASTESSDGRFLPTLGSGPASEAYSPDRSPTMPRDRTLGLERTGSYSDIPPTSMGIARAGQQHNRLASSSPDFSPAPDRKHKAVKACYSVPNMTGGGQLRVADLDDGDDDDDDDFSGDILSVKAAVGSPASSSFNLAEPGLQEEDEYNRLNKSNQRRVSRNEKRYYTADSIQELRNKDKDSSIHKRLSWQNENHPDERLGKKVFSADSVTSIPSSSGVSSNASLHLNPESDITEETEMQRSGSSRTLQGESGSPKSDSVDMNSHSSKAKSTSDIVSLFSTLRTGEQEDGISSVDLPLVLKDGEPSRRLTHAQILKMKKQLLLNTDVEASEV